MIISLSNTQISNIIGKIKIRKKETVKKILEANTDKEMSIWREHYEYLEEQIRILKSRL